MMRRPLLILLAVSAPAAAQRAPSGRIAITPYVEVGQIVDADLTNDDVLTYTSIAGGVDAAADTARLSAQLSYRYERRISWSDRIGDSDVHAGLARAAAQVGRGLTIEAGGIATRTRADIRGAAPGVIVGDGDNVSQVYAVYAGPRYSGAAGPIALAASYQAAYTKVSTPRIIGLAGQPRLDRYDDSVGQIAAISAGTAPNTLLPIGLTASAGYEREDAGQLSARYEGLHLRGDALAPMSANVALVAGVGYEKIKTSQRDALRDASGAPVVDRDGRFVTDDVSPRRIAYRTDGVYYDAGVVWRPNRRTAVEGRIGRRYGSTSYTGTIAYQASAGVGFAAKLYDSVTTFGQQLRGGLGNLPTSFVAARDSFTQQYNGCVYGTSGATPGGCLNSVFQSISTASYRARGADAVIAATQGRTSFGGGVGYASRKLYAPVATAGITVSGYDDESYYAQLFLRRAISADTALDATVFVNYFDPGLAGSDGVVSYGATASVGRAFGRLTTTASIGVYAFDTATVDTQISAQALAAARYSF
ncbi:hypothetical protein ACT009_03355 [Sphingomonas sp. Tas61C01]|uniref:hypothetical protein n=1 Tax=Sphingomonas sp. Tas61C01 TaxID=3458297 RepID=UPI00403EF526